MRTNKNIFTFVKKTTVIIFIIIFFVLNVSLYSQNPSEYNENKVKQKETKVRGYEQKKEYNKVIKIYEEILNFKNIPDSTRLRIRQKLVAFCQKYKEIANSDYISALIVLFSDQATDSIGYKLGMACLSAGRESDAIKYLNQTLYLNPNHFYANFQLGKFYHNQDRDYTKALSFFQKCAYLNPNHGESQYFLASAYYNKNQIQEARNALEKVINLPIISDDIFFLLAKIYEGLDELEKALAMYEKIIILTQDNEKKIRAQQKLESVNKKIDDYKKLEKQWNEQSRIIKTAEPFDNLMDVAFQNLAQIANLNTRLNSKLDSLKLEFWQKLWDTGQEKCSNSKWSDAVKLFEKAEKYSPIDTLCQVASKAKADAQINKRYQIDITKLISEAQTNIQNKRPEEAIKKITAVIEFDKNGSIVPRERKKVYELRSIAEQNANYKMGIQAFDAKDWYSTVTFFNKVNLSIYPGLIDTINIAKKKILTDALIALTKKNHNDSNLDLSYWSAEIALFIESNDSTIKELRAQKCKNLADSSFTKEDWIRSKYYYQIYLSQINKKDKDSLEKLKQIDQYLSKAIIVINSGTINLLYFWLAIIFLLLFLAFWPLFFWIKYRSKLEEQTMKYYLKNRLFVPWSTKIKLIVFFTVIVMALLGGIIFAKFHWISLLAWILLLLFGGLLFLCQKYPTMVYFTIHSSFAKFNFVMDKLKRQSNPLCIDKLQSKSLQLKGVKELSLNVFNLFEVGSERPKLKNVTINLKPALRTGEFDLSFLPFRNKKNNKLSINFDMSASSELLLENITNQLILPAKIETKNSNENINVYINDNFDIELSDCSVWINNKCEETIKDNEKKRYHIILVNNQKSISVGFGNLNPLVMEFALINDVLESIPEKFDELNLFNIDFRTPTSKRSNILSGTIGYSNKKEITKLDKASHYYLKADNLTVSDFKINKSYIEIEFNTVAKSLKWSRSEITNQNRGFQEIPSYYDKLKSDNRYLPLILFFLSWLIPTIIGILEIVLNK